MESHSDYRPNYAATTYQLDVQRETNLVLFRRKTGAQPAMDFVQAYNVDADNSKLIIKLKRDCAWSDGKNINAQHMLKGIQLVFEAKQTFVGVFAPFFKNGVAVLNGQKPLSELGVRVVGEYTLEFDLVSSPDLLIQALTYYAFTPAPLHLVEKNASAWPVKSILRVSSGPYQAISMNKNIIKMEKNPYFCRSIPVNFDTVDFIGENMKLNWPKQLMLNRIDVAHEVKPEQARAIISGKPNINISSIERSAGKVAYIIVRLNSVKLESEKERAKLRQVVRMMVDYRIIERIVSNSQIGDLLLGIVPEFPRYASIKSNKPLTMNRIANAQKLMQELGYGENNRLQIKFLGGTTHAIYRKLQRAFSSMLKQVYIDLELGKDLPNIEVWNKAQKGEFDLTVATWAVDINDPSNYLEGMIDYFIPMGEFKLAVESKLVSSYKEFNQKKRFAILKEVEKEVLESGYIIPMFELKSHYLLRPNYHLLDEPRMSSRNIKKQGCP